jgi:ankyrin repeat protein
VKCQLFSGFRELALSDTPDAAEAALQLSVCYCIGFGVVIDTAEARHWIAESAWKGSVRARGLIRRLFEACGEAIPSDFPIASWLSQATIAGSRIASADLEKLDLVGYLHSRDLLQLSLCKPETCWLPSDDPTNISNILGRVTTLREEGTRVASLSINSDGDTLLHYAATQGNTELAEFLLQGPDSEDIDAPNRGGETALLYACRAGHSEMVKFLILKHGADVKKESSNGVTPLHWIISLVEPTLRLIAELLVNAGADTEAKTTSPVKQNSHSSDDLPPGTPLSWAIAVDYELAIRTLLDLEALPAIGVHGHSLLRNAVFTRSSNVVEILLQEDICIADLDDFDDSERSILSYAINGENRFSGLVRHGANYHNSIKSTIKLLADNGADMTVVALTSSGDEDTAFMYAVRNCPLEILEILLSLGYSDQIDLRCGDTSPLIWAIENEHQEKFDFLMKHGAAAGSLWIEPTHRTLLHACSYSAKYGTYFAKELIERGADVNTASAEGFSPLGEAMSEGNLGVAKLLLESGASMTVIDSNGFNILGSVLSDCSTAALAGVEFALENGLGDYIVHSSRRLGALHLGICFTDKLHDGTAHRQIFNLLLSSFKSRIDDVDISGWSPLHLAAAAGDPYALQALLKAGADYSLLDKHGRTALDIARKLAKVDTSTFWTQTAKPALHEFEDYLVNADMLDNVGEGTDLGSEFEKLLNEEYGLADFREKWQGMVELFERLINTEAVASPEIHSH